MVEPLRIFIGTDDSQVVAHRVLEHTIRKTASIPVEVTPMLNIPHPQPRDPKNKPRTTFSLCRFLIPELCGYQGRALYLDADMLVFEDIAELANLAFDERTVLCTAPAPTEAWDAHETEYLGRRSVAVMLLDCGRLPWKIDEVVEGLDTDRYSYHELLSDVCIVEPSAIADTIPPEWNDLERYTPGRTKLLHYTVVPTQPWKTDGNPLGELWMDAYREAVAAGAVPSREVEAGIAAGYLKPSLRGALRFAPDRGTMIARMGDRIARSVRGPRELARRGGRRVQALRSGGAGR